MEDFQVYENLELKKPQKPNFNKFFEASVKKAEEEAKKTVYVNVNLTTPEDMLTIDFDTISDEELFKQIKMYYSDILYSIMSYNDCRYISLFMNSKFLMVLNQVLSQEQYIDHSNICYLNKLVYDYAVLEDKDQYTMNALMTIARTINRTIISKLIGIGLPDHIATDIAICRYSNSDDVICTKRLTNKLIQQSRELMTEQMIVNIYQELYSHMTPLFIGVMYDIYTENELAAFGPDASFINSTINLAILDLLDSMTSDNIRKVLIVYSQDYKLNSNFDRVRFDISACPDYPRILEVVHNLQTFENIIMP
jgi:hypothetical protein